VTDESDPPTISGPLPADEPSSDAGAQAGSSAASGSGGKPGPGTEPLHGGKPLSGREPPSSEPDASEGTGDGVGTVIAFSSRPRSGAAGRTSSDSAGRETSAPSGYDVDNEPVLADAGTNLTGGTVLITDADGQGAGADDGGDDASPVDWAWVEEWRTGREPVPWASGLGLAGFSALVVGVAVWVLSAGLAGSPVLAIGVNLLVAGGLAPAMWLSRGLPVLRWIALGSAVGVLAGWVCALTMLPLPTP
jgi:Protein of unknown function (DUF2537)